MINPSATVLNDLRSTYLFSRLTETEIQHLIPSVHEVRLADGQTLFQANEPATRFYLVKSGQVILSRFSISGGEKVIEVVRPGYTFAEAMIFHDNARYPVSARALGPTCLYAIEARGFVEMLRGSVDTCFRVMSDMSLRLHRMIKEIDDLTLQNATDRVIGYLCGQYRLQNDPEGISLNTPKGVLASRLSVKPETLSRILASLSTQGLIQVNGSRVLVLNPAALGEMSAAIGYCGGDLGPH